MIGAPALSFFIFILFIVIGAKLAVAPVARATPLFLPRPEIIYINVVHYSAPPRTYLLRATPLFRPLWRHWLFFYPWKSQYVSKLGT